MSSTDLTPDHWRHVRIVESGDLFSLVGYYTHMPFGPSARKALGLVESVDNIDLLLCLELGEKVEQRLSQRQQ